MKKYLLLSLFASMLTTLRAGELSDELMQLKAKLDDLQNSFGGIGRAKKQLDPIINALNVAISNLSDSYRGEFNNALIWFLADPESINDFRKTYYSFEEKIAEVIPPLKSLNNFQGPKNSILDKDLVKDTLKPLIEIMEVTKQRLEAIGGMPTEILNKFTGANYKVVQDLVRKITSAWGIKVEVQTK